MNPALNSIDSINSILSILSILLGGSQNLGRDFQEFSDFPEFGHPHNKKPHKCETRTKKKEKKRKKKKKYTKTLYKTPHGGPRYPSLVTARTRRAQSPDPTSAVAAGAVGIGLGSEALGPPSIVLQSVCLVFSFYFSSFFFFFSFFSFASIVRHLGPP